MRVCVRVCVCDGCSVAGMIGYMCGCVCGYVCRYVWNRVKVRVWGACACVQLVFICCINVAGFIRLFTDISMKTSRRCCILLRHS